MSAAPTQGRRDEADRSTSGKTMMAEPENRPGVKRHLLIAAVVFLLCAAAYANALRNGFVYDDNAIISYNPLIKSLANLPRILTTGYWGAENTDSGLYRPVVIASYAVDHAFWKLNATAFHAGNILLHAGVAVLAYFLLLGFAVPIRVAALTAMVFAVHPVHVEAVSGIVGRAEILSAGCTLTALLLHLRFVHTRRAVHLAGSALAFLAAVLCKESAIVFPLLALAIEASARSARGRKSPAPGLLPYVIYGLVVASVFAIRALVLGPSQTAGPVAVSIMDNPLYDLPVAQRIGSAFYVLARYMGLLLFPIRLSADYSYSQIPAIQSILDMRLLTALATACGATWLLMHSFGRRPTLFIAAVFLLLPLLPVSNLIVSIGTIMAERLLYLPVLGFGMLLALGFERLHRRATPAIAWALFGVLIAGYTARAAVRNRDWRDDVTLFTAALEVVPRSSRMHLFMGRQYNGRGEYEEAVDHLDRSLAILPWNPEALSELGYAHLTTGGFDEAGRRFRQAVQMDPDNVGAHLGLARLYQQQGRYEEAMVELWQCVDLAPLLLEARVQIGVVRYTIRDYAAAVPTFEAVLNLDPTSIASEYYLGIMEKERGEMGEMERRFERVIASERPWDVEGHIYLGLICDQLGMTDKAYASFAAALTMNPHSAFSKAVLAQHHLRRGAYRDALEEARGALEANRYAVEAMQAAALAYQGLGHPADAESLLVSARSLRARDPLTALHLANLYVAQGRWDEAERELRRAWTFDPGSGAILTARGNLERARGDYVRARELYSDARATRLDPTTVDIEVARLNLTAGDGASALARLDALASRGDLSPRHRYEVGLLYEALDRFEEADEAYRLALAAQPKNADYLYQRGESLLRAGRYDDAEKLLGDLLGLYPKHSDGMNAVAWLYLQRDKVAGALDPAAPARAVEALRWADEAIAVDSTLAFYHDTRAEALLLLGREREAIEAWKEATRFDPLNAKYAARASRVPSAPSARPIGAKP